MRLPQIAITLGDINGVGPEILAKALARPEPWMVCRPIIVGDARVFESARAFAPDCPPGEALGDLDAAPHTEAVPILDVGFPAPQRKAGILSREAGRCAVEWVKTAIRWAIDGRIDAIVTCPINKEGIHQAGYPYAGHTELIAEMTGSPDYRMCLFAGGMRLVHITSHMSMLEAIDAVRTERIVRSIHTGHEALARLGLARRRIAVAALNPHAGEAGAFGREEIEEIVPAIQACRAEGIDCLGPFPADTIFRRVREGEFDLVVAMYHDQGHIPAKLIAMDEGVNVTLGIPIIRTSVDHGTAYDIAGTGAAREDSLIAAIELAAQFAATRARSQGPNPGDPA